METTAISAPAISDLANGAIDTAETHKARVFAKAKARRIARGDAEAHRLRGIARLQAATNGAPTKILRLEITNVLSGNDYSARVAIGSTGAVANVILDTGSSTLAVEPSVYSGVGDQDLKPTTLLQLITYGTGGWAGPMVDTTLAFGADAGQVVLPNCPIAITTVQESGNFQGVTGIMGLAYNGLNSAFDFGAYLATQGKESTFPWPFGKVWSSFLAGFPGLLQRARATVIERNPISTSWRKAAWWRTSSPSTPSVPGSACAWAPPWRLSPLIRSTRAISSWAAARSSTTSTRAISPS